MRNLKKALALGTTALAAMGLHGSTFAQAPAAQPGVQPGAAVQVNANPNAVANAAADEQHHTRQMITHALNMAINGSGLQFTAQAQGRRRQGDSQGENRDRNQNAANRNDNNNANADNRRDENANNRRDGEQDRPANQEAIQQLRQLAWRQFESGNGLLHDADTNLNAAGNNAANARDERSAWTRRLHSAANQYATSLRSLSGVGSKAPEASTSGDADDQNNRERDRNREQAGANQDQNQNRRSGGNDGGLNRTEVAQIVLLNQAVRESIEAFELNQTHRHAYGVNRAAPNNNAVQRLQGHSRQMATDCEQILQRVQASLNREGGQADQNRDQNQNQNQNRRDDQDRNDRQDNARNQGDNNGERGQASVRALAQQARQIVETLQRIESAESAVAAPAR